ncbi:hypothetical protein AA481_004659 [Salmonella enterica subsp. enterica]|nr:hypothetical protein [Salmonella enterica subsp. enterica serovar Abaetetuba]
MLLVHTIRSLSISLCDINRINHHSHDNKQSYNHAVKLPGGRSGQIRLFALSEVFGSLPGSGNNHTALFRW